MKKERILTLAYERARSNYLDAKHRLEDGRFLYEGDYEKAEREYNEIKLLFLEEKRKNFNEYARMYK